MEGFFWFVKDITIHRFLGITTVSLSNLVRNLEIHTDEKPQGQESY